MKEIEITRGSDIRDGESRLNLSREVALTLRGTIRDFFDIGALKEGGFRRTGETYGLTDVEVETVRRVGDGWAVLWRAEGGVQ